MLEIKHQVLTASLCSGILCLALLYDLISECFTYPTVIEAVGKIFICVSCGCVSVLLCDIYRFGPASSLTYRQMIDRYKEIRNILKFGKLVNQRDEFTLDNSLKVQHETFHRLLDIGSKTKYGKHIGLDTIKTMAEYRTKLPLTTYEPVRSWVDKVLQGEDNVLFPGPVIYLGTTSGTTGKYKIFPKCMSAASLVKDYLYYKSFYVYYTLFPSVGMKKVLTIQTFYPPSKVDIGISQGPISSMFAIYNPMFVVPKEGFFLTNTEASKYITLIFALREKDIGIISSLFSSPVLALFQMLEKHWGSLCDDVELGRIRSGYEIPEEVLIPLRVQFKPHPKRAAFLRSEFKRGFHAIAKRIWPGCELAVMMTSGAFHTASEMLQQNYLEGLTIYSRLHGGTEGGYGITINDFSINPDYYLLPSICFSELLPIDQDTDETVLPQEAEIGKHYELIITTEEGLYRYKTTDVIEAVGFHGQTLKYKFSQRMGDTLYLINEKTPVHVIESALYDTLRKMAPDIVLVNFSCTESRNVDRVTGDTCGVMAYWLFIETKGKDLPIKFADEVDDYLIRVLDSYRGHRQHQTMDKIRITQVPCTTFDKLRAFILTQRPNASHDQYKTPRLVRNDEFLAILLGKQAPE